MRHSSNRNVNCSITNPLKGVPMRHTVRAFFAFAFFATTLTACTERYGDDIVRDASDIGDGGQLCGTQNVCDNGEPCPPCADLGNSDAIVVDGSNVGDLVTVDGGATDGPTVECDTQQDCDRLAKCQGPGIRCNCDSRNSGSVCEPVALLDGGQVDQTPLVDMLVLPDLIPVPSCTDKMKNGAETDVDCGGNCAAKCDDGKGCLRADDCKSALCSNNVCRSSISCSDLAKNQDETDVDCGGTMCAKCADGRSCLRGSDCASTLCSNNVCRPAFACNDGAMNGAETDVDCGGANMCVRCADGKKCVRGSDCSSALCSNNVCLAQPACNDMVRNQTESDVDCGGTCPKCGLDKLCGGNVDCVSGNCMNGKCSAPLPTCNDASKNGAETDVDCGGNVCAKCVDGKMCVSGSDCVSGNCLNNVCRAALSCNDGLKNQNETDVDCGGMCPKCANGKVCSVNADCASTLCTNGICVAMVSCSDTVKNGSETDVDCGGNACAKCALNKACLVNADCASGLCSNNVCTQPQQMASCNDGQKNGAETDVDCGGMNACNRCSDGKACATNFDCSSGDCTSGVCRALQAGNQALGFTVNFAPTDGKSVSSATIMEYLPAFQSICTQMAAPGNSLTKLDCTFQVSANLLTLDANVPINGGMYYLVGTGPNGVEVNGTLVVTSVNKGVWLVKIVQNAQMTGYNFRISAPTCNDTAMDGFETDVDCGGKGCGPCANGKKCAVNSDCSSMKCTAGTCQP